MVLFQIVSRLTKSYHQDSLAFLLNNQGLAPIQFLQIPVGHHLANSNLHDAQQIFQKST